MESSAAHLPTSRFSSDSSLSGRERRRLGKQKQCRIIAALRLRNQQLLERNKFLQMITVSMQAYQIGSAPPLRLAPQASSVANTSSTAEIFGIFDTQELGDTTSMCTQTEITYDSHLVPLNTCKQILKPSVQYLDKRVPMKVIQPPSSGSNSGDAAPGDAALAGSVEHHREFHPNPVVQGAPRGGERVNMPPMSDAGVAGLGHEADHAFAASLRVNSSTEDGGGSGHDDIANAPGPNKAYVPPGEQTVRLVLPENSNENVENDSAYCEAGQRLCGPCATASTALQVHSPTVYDVSATGISTDYNSQSLAELTAPLVDSVVTVQDSNPHKTAITDDAGAAWRLNFDASGEQSEQSGLDV